MRITLTEAALLIEIKERYKLAKLYRQKWEVDRAIEFDGFWGDSIIDLPILDRFIYKGKGRPKKTDYTTLLNLQKKLNTLLNKKFGNFT